MIASPKLTIEQIIKIVNSTDEITLETKEQLEEWETLKNLIVENLRIDIAEFTADEDEFLRKLLRGLVCETKREIVEKFRSIQEKSL